MLNINLTEESEGKSAFWTRKKLEREHYNIRIRFPRNTSTNYSSFFPSPCLYTCQTYFSAAIYTRMCKQAQRLHKVYTCVGTAESQRNQRSERSRRIMSRTKVSHHKFLMSSAPHQHPIYKFSGRRWASTTTATIAPPTCTRLVAIISSITCSIQHCILSREVMLLQLYPSARK